MSSSSAMIVSRNSRAVPYSVRIVHLPLNPTALGCTSVIAHIKDALITAETTRVHERELQLRLLGLLMIVFALADYHAFALSLVANL